MESWTAKRDRRSQTVVLKERLRWTDGVAVALIYTGVTISMLGREFAARAQKAGGVECALSLSTCPVTCMVAQREPAARE